MSRPDQHHHMAERLKMVMRSQESREQSAEMNEERCGMVLAPSATPFALVKPQIKKTGASQDQPIPATLGAS